MFNSSIDINALKQTNNLTRVNNHYVQNAKKRDSTKPNKKQVKYSGNVMI